MDVTRMEEAIRSFLEALGQRFDGDDLERTPARVARAWSEDLAGGYAVDPVGELTWTEIRTETGPVIVRGIRFTSICVHHLLPFFGSAHVAYLPAERLAGLSKIGRVVDAHARRLQTQERLTAAIVETLREGLAPRGVLALLEAEHSCMTCRGVRKEQSRMLTMAAAGQLESDAAARREILELFDADPNEAPVTG
jgi:GTP cyclohydrolase I